MQGFDGRKNNSCNVSNNVSKLVVHVLFRNFAMDSLKIWNAILIVRIKTDVCVCVWGGGGM